jgi:signal transduction histidine kinase/DNA-binding response OmpR family regulator
VSTPEPATILLVDDQPANLFAMQQTLTAPGYELVLAESGEKALAYLLRGACAAILLDVSMPGMDGYEVARLVRRNPRTRNIPIVFVTAMAQDERDVLGGYECGAIDYLVKPIRPEVLRSKVAGLVALYRAQQEIRRQAELLREHERLQHRHELAELELRFLQRQQAAQRRYQTVVDGLSRAVAFVLDPETLVPRLVSPGARDLLGVDAEWWSAAARPWVVRIHPEDRGRFVEVVRALAAGAPATRLGHRMLGPQGRTVWVETSLRLIHGEEPSSSELHGLSTDVTDAVLAREDEGFLSRASAELAGSLDVASTLRTAARLPVPELAEWCVVEAGAARGIAAAHERPDRDDATHVFAANLDPARVRALDGTAEVAPATLARDEEAPGGLDALPPARALVVPLVAHGERLGTLCLFACDPARLDPVLRGRTGELARRIAQALENAALHEQTQAAVLAREHFLSIASHELRTPLTALALQSRLLAQAVERVTALPDEREELVRRVHSIQRQTARLGALANTVLDLTRIRSARLKLELESCDLVEVARDVVARFEDGLRAEGRNVALVSHGSLVGRWDRTRVEQLLSNLVGNAVKHGGRGAITVSAEPAGDAAVLTVSDTGPGIPESEQERVFDAFSQGTRAAEGGLGLGLYIARWIALAHGGRLDLASAPSLGTTFRVELPLDPGAAFASGFSEPPEASAAAR